MEYVWIALEHVPDRRAELAQTSFAFFLFFRLESVGILGRGEKLVLNQYRCHRMKHHNQRTFCQAAFFSANVFKALYNGSVMIVLIV